MIDKEVTTPGAEIYCVMKELVFHLSLILSQRHNLTSDLGKIRQKNQRLQYVLLLPNSVRPTIMV